MSLHEAEKAIKNNQNSILVLSDETLHKGGLKQSILATKRCLVMMSRFTNNQWMKDIDLNQTKSGRSAVAILNKLKFFRKEDRTKVGVFMMNSNYNDLLASILLDTPEIEYISYPFFDVPAVKFDFLINMATKYKSL